jgi:putative acetyltransferase
MLVRSEMPKDYEAITQVTLAAFTSGSYNPNEHLIIKGLRETGALSLSLVAEVDKGIVGHVAFSVVLINGEAEGWYGLGPIAVQPQFQKGGIGSRLINAGLSKLQEMGAQGCVLVGSPRYYNRFGFKFYPGLIYEKVPAPEYFMVIPFYGEVPTGKVGYHSAFYTPPP